MTLPQKLREWRAKKAREEKVELFRIFQNKTLEDFTTILPRNKDKLLTIKGIKEKKFQKYGQEILSIIAECVGVPEIKKDLKVDEIFSVKEKIYSVSNFLDLVNFNLAKIQVGIKGEVSSVNFKGHAYFSLKDKDDESVINCFMWSDDYKMSGIDLKEGIEVIIHGYPEIYKPSGKFTFKTSSIELVGEGALKKAYDKLKKKFTIEGIFDEAKKKPIPEFPSKIGLITSKDGAVINDFLNNLGRFNYKISFYDSRVEGAQAVKDLITAVKYFKNKPIDVLVVIRGGGSLESLQAFNNEVLIREIVNYPIPIICGIGHDKDVPLFSSAADKAVSTPSIVAKEINKSWELAVERISRYKSDILDNFSSIVANRKSQLDNYFYQFGNYYRDIIQKISTIDQIINNSLNHIKHSIKNMESRIIRSAAIFINNFSNNLIYSNEQIKNSIKLLRQHDPNHQLKLGYSIIFLGNKVIKSVEQIKKNDILKSRLSDGEVLSITKEIKNRKG